MKYEYKVKGIDYQVEIQNIEGNIANVTVNGIPFEVEMKKKAKVVRPKVKLVTPVTTTTPSTPEPKKKEEPAPVAASGKLVVAPLPGTINEIKVKVGDKVNVGDTVVVLEAMKMQNNIEAESAGTIASIHVTKGDAVSEGDTLVVIND